MASPTPGATFVVWLIVIVAVGFVMMLLFKAAVWWGEHMSSARDDEMDALRSPVSIPVSSMPYRASDIPDIDAETSSDRDIMGDDAWIDRMARARGQGKPYQFSANQIHAAIGGDRNAVLAKVRAIRDAAPPAEYFREDGTRGPATHPVTGRRSAA